jgi:hypothetical protein
MVHYKWQSFGALNFAGYGRLDLYTVLSVWTAWPPALY